MSCSFWSYELSKRALSIENDDRNREALKTLLCGGLAGVITWASIFPLGLYRPLPSLSPLRLLTDREDVVKTRVQTWDLSHKSSQGSIVPHVAQPLLVGQEANVRTRRPSTLQITKEVYAAEGLGVFFKGLGVCSARAFIVNAVQWTVSLTSLADGQGHHDH